MLDLPLLQDIASRLMEENPALGTKRIGRGRLRTVKFDMNGREYQAIEQNPEKPSRWGQLARAGHKVVQFKDVALNKYVAVAVDGEVKEYGRSTA